MSDQTIFEGNSQEVKKEESQETLDDKQMGGNSNTQNAQEQSEPFADLLGQIRNERGEPKYRSTEDALKALNHSQQFIPELQNENKQLKSQLEELKSQMDRFKNIEETVSRLTASQEQADSTNQPRIDEQTIADMMERTLTKREQEVRQKTNVSQVAKTMQDKFGPDAEKVFYSKASELGMDAQTINGLAASSPQAVLQLFGLSGQQERTVNTHSTGKQEVNTAGFQPKQESFVSRNTKSFSAGATTQDYMQEAQAARQMVEELHEKGLSVSDLSDPKKYFNTFK